MSQLLQLVAALVFTLALIGLCAFIAQRFGQKLPLMGRGGANARLSVVEWKALDGKHQLFLLRRDDLEHLVILSPHGSPVVVEAGIKRESVPTTAPLTATVPPPVPLGPADPVLRS